MTDTLRNKLKKLPVAPGVYFHKNQAGEIIYIGKAAVLKNRVRQYFQKTVKDPKTTALVQEIADVDWQVVDTEMDALFLESEMIKRYMPKWNVLLRDDKTVSYIRINFQDKIPHVSITRTPLDDGAKYVGPFYGKSAIERSLRILRKIFPFYDRPYTGRKPSILTSASRQVLKSTKLHLLFISAIYANSCAALRVGEINY